MALDIFEVIGVNGNLIKFTVDKDSNNQLTLVTTSKTVGELGFYPNRYNQTGSSAIIKSGSGSLLAFKVENLNVNTNKFLMLFNQNSLPTANQTTNIIDVFHIPFGQVISFDSNYFSVNGSPFTSGLAWGWSSSRSQFIASLTDLDLSVVCS
jgi:hypothetical protein